MEIFSSHGEVIQKIRAAAKKTAKRVTILADLPGPKSTVWENIDDILKAADGIILEKSVEREFQTT